VAWVVSTAMALSKVVVVPLGSQVSAI
jgi:hypothetical protein